MSPPAHAELQWWANSVEKWNGEAIVPQRPDLALTLETDASGLGWGVVGPGVMLQGQWTESEARNSSNWRELSATLIAAKAHASLWVGKTMLIKSDNMTTVSAEYVPGTENTRVDMASRVFLNWHSYKMTTMAFQRLRTETPHNLTTDLFASITSTQLPHMVDRVLSGGARLSAGAAATASAARAPSTLAAYGKTYARFARWCADAELDPLDGTVLLIEWLQLKLDDSAIKPKTAISYAKQVCQQAHILSPLGPRPAMDDPLLSSFLKGAARVFVRPPVARVGWDVGVLLAYLRTFVPVSIKDHAVRCATLLALCTTWRPGSDLNRIVYDSLSFTDANGHVLPVQELSLASPVDRADFAASLTKTKVVQRTHLAVWASDPALCPIRALLAYVVCTRDLCSSSGGSLFVSAVTPHGPVSETTVRLWVKSALMAAGINVNAHSIRAVSASTADKDGVARCDLLAAANWRNESTFHRYYRRDVPKRKADAPPVQAAVLKRARHMPPAPTAGADADAAPDA
ncbi:hypothetical protein AMAG_18239 [Allomyces macrogynus ATCC 38327]|uniref:Tyr recombinase domain-containing protein n=1 Tax=Allomyces macrogynus (strain ATCC 38327) TaxID=578462 RepID=A0A0L0S794_ALLM3|nr:hypothetical protein AMAG_18239 [Allomyces macrogynus ATCC 38327]|eukprot:KNE58392.1 hypothetical protein AMAG_18239 [Allomyces macrogynus ATCC 38327]